MHEKDEERIAGEIAKTLALMYVRNTFLEKIHEGITPVTKTGDYSDVKVIDAEGREISWVAVSRINDHEMKKLMKEVVNRLYTWLAKSEDVIFRAGMDRWNDTAQKWDDPELDPAFLENVQDDTKA